MQTKVMLLTKSKTPRLKMVRLLKMNKTSVRLRAKKTKKKELIKKLCIKAFQFSNLSKTTMYPRRAMKMFQQTMLAVQMKTKQLLVQMTTKQLLVLQSNPSMLNANRGIQGYTNGRT